MKPKRQELRLPPALHRLISEAASINHRSVNAEVIHRLEFSFNEEETIKRLEAVEEELRLLKFESHEGGRKRSKN
jgi:hypothetical protein